MAREERPAESVLKATERAPHKNIAHGVGVEGVSKILTSLHSKSHTPHFHVLFRDDVQC